MTGPTPPLRLFGGVRGGGGSCAYYTEAKTRCAISVVSVSVDPRKLYDAAPYVLS